MSQPGYERMSAKGRQVCEYIELAARHDELAQRARVMPGYRVPRSLMKELQKRYSEFAEADKRAIVAFRDFDNKSDQHPCWIAWVRQHLSEAPGDAADLLQLERGFSKHVTFEMADYIQLHGRPWRMQHTE